MRHHGPFTKAFAVTMGILAAVTLWSLIWAFLILLGLAIVASGK